MHKLTRVTCLGLAVVLAGTSMSSALGLRQAETFEPIRISIKGDNTPVDLRNDPPIIIKRPFGSPTDPLPGGIDGAIADSSTDNPGLVCVVDGDDLLVTNKGDTIRLGSRLEWSASNGQQGAVPLLDGLHAGEQARIEDGLDTEAATCTAAILS